VTKRRTYEATFTNGEMIRRQTHDRIYLHADSDQQTVSIAASRYGAGLLLLVKAFQQKV
jgi:hypothetical protein